MHVCTRMYMCVQVCMLLLKLSLDGSVWAPLAVFHGCSSSEDRVLGAQDEVAQGTNSETLVYNAFCNSVPTAFM